MFRAFGHANSSVLDGGLPRLEDEGYPLNTGPPCAPKKVLYPLPQLDADTIRSEEDIHPIFIF